mmetsp:Transcript_61457/g.143847  ORF Transcript_61457/g.143847 Transcript_61457/m.143847 type:complete len:130 (+) Transcript_61457:481-870(+)
MQAVAHERETSNWCGRAANLHGFKAWKREQVIPSPCSTWVSQMGILRPCTTCVSVINAEALADAWNATVVDPVAPVVLVDKFAPAACSVRGRASVRTVTGRRACAVGCAKCAENRVLHVIRSVDLMRLL